MAENAPQAGEDGSRGQAYYEKLRRDLRKILHDKQQLDQTMANLEDNIYKVETQYLEETTAGNIIKGFDNYLKGSTTSATNVGGAGTSTRRKHTISDTDRIFSKSSQSLLRESDVSLSTATTPSNAATPVSAKEGSAPAGAGGTLKLGNKKKKARDDDDDEEKKPNKRGKITYGRE